MARGFRRLNDLLEFKKSGEFGLFSCFSTRLLNCRAL